MTKKITKATFKAFIKNNIDNLQIMCVSSFNGMTDGVDTDPHAKFSPIEKTDRNVEYTLGISGLWLVGQSRDYFSEYNADGMKGITVYNSCGTQVIAVAA